MFASFRNHPLVVADLLAHGADSASVTSRWGYTALDIAIKEGHSDVVKLLEAHQRLHRSKAAVAQQTDSSIRPADEWMFKLLKCGSCGAVLARKDFPIHCIDVHAGDKDFDWKCTNGAWDMNIFFRSFQFVQYFGLTLLGSGMF